MFSWGPAITLHIIQWDLEPSRSWAVYAIKKLLSPRSSQCGDKILSSQLVYCSRLGHRSQIIQGHAKTIHVPLNLEKAFFATSGFNQFVVNSECQTHFRGPLKYMAVTRGCSCNSNTSVQRVLLPLDDDCAKNGSLVTMLFWIQILFPVEKALGWTITSSRAICSLVICVVIYISKDSVSMCWGGDSCQVLQKPLSYMKQAPSPAHLCILLLTLQPPSCASSLLWLWFCQYGNVLRGTSFI